MRLPKKWNLPTLIFAFLFAVSAIFNVYLFNKKQQPLISDYAVIGVIDGDTFLIEGKHKIRLRHTQAPELNFCGGPEAKKALDDLIKGKRVTFKNEIPDPWGRQMAMVFVGDKNINLEIVRTGLSRYYHDATPFEDEMKNAGALAEKEKLGIFKNCESITPPDPKCVIKGNIRNDRDTKKYYLPDCPQYKFAKVSQDLGEQWFCTEKEANAAGFTKAENCP